MSIVLYGCVVMYGLSLLLAPSQVRLFDGIFSILSPGGGPLILLGMSGAVPVFQEGRWWTVLSAAWLHGGALHIVMNLLWIQQLSDVVGRFFGISQLIILYTVSSITGFALSSFMGLFTFLPGPLRGAFFTVGASAPLFGLFGALVFYGQRTGNRALTAYGNQFVIVWLVIGVMMGLGDVASIRIDNWAHLGGFGGGYLAARLLNPNPDLPENPKHPLLAIGCLILTVLSVVMSVLHGLG